MSDQAVTARITYKDLCIDVTDPAITGPFWAAALGLTAEPVRDTVVLRDAVDEHQVWLNVVPERKSVKHRVHLDVHAASIQALQELGATVLDDSERWTVMADPDGGEFCAFVRLPDEVPVYRMYELSVDCRHPARLATWWAERYGVAAEMAPGQDFWWVEGGPGMPWPMVFSAVGEPKMIKNRVHWDVWGVTDELVAAGASIVRAQDDEISWDVLADPEGNEFCVFAR